MEKVCDRVAIVDHGRVVAQGAIEEIATVREKRILIATTDDSRAEQAVRDLTTLALGGWRTATRDARTHARLSPFRSAWGQQSDAEAW